MGVASSLSAAPALNCFPQPFHPSGAPCVTDEEIAEVPSIMHMTANVASLFESGKTDAVEVWLREVLGQVEKVNPDFVSM